MVTSDLVFAQVSTEHPLEGYVPSVTFLGTRFENLRIAGREVEPVFDLGICGAKPEGDKPYLQDPGFLGRVSQQYEQISSLAGLPDWVGQQYHDSAKIRQAGKVECSLVTNVERATPGTSFGHMIEVPGFGRVSLAKLTVDSAFNLSMVRVDAGPSGVQSLDVPSGGTNGNTKP
jgi:hypothetical protein